MNELVRIMELAEGKGISLGSFDMSYFQVDLDDGFYDLSECTWRYEGEVDEDRNMSGVFTKIYPNVVIVKEGVVDFVSVLEAIESKSTNNHFDPHNYFEGFTVKDGKIEVHFAS